MKILLPSAQNEGFLVGLTASLGMTDDVILRGVNPEESQTNNVGFLIFIRNDIWVSC